MKTKFRRRMEIKELAADGSFEGLLSPYGNVDGGGDVVLPGAYAKTIKEQGGQVPMLWQHSAKDPIGMLTLEDRPDGLWCKGQFLMEDPLAARAYRFVKARIVKGLSIGFEAVKDSVSNGVRQLHEIKLYEGSVVTFPMNESALIASVKSRGEAKGDFNEELTQIQLQDAGSQMLYALRCALSSITWSNLSREDKVSARATVIQQFADADAAYFPMYLDMLTEMYGGMETWNQKRIETKAGKKISAATKESLTAARDHMTSATDLFAALLEEEAGEDPTSTTEAAAPKSEPVDHSAISNVIKELKGIWMN